MTAATMTEARAMVAAMDVRAMLLVTTATTAEAMVTAMAVMHYGGCGVVCVCVCVFRQLGYNTRASVIKLTLACANTYP
jgi:hypothetical protein